MKIDKFLILIILFILGLSFATYGQFKGFRESLSKVGLPKFEMPELKLFSPQEEIGYQEFVSPDGKLKLKYSSDWMKMEKESLAKLNQEMIKEGAKILFFGQKIKIEKVASASLVIQEINLGGKSLEEIIEEMKEDVRKKEGEVEITQLKIKEKEAYLEAEYKREEGTIFNSKERILLSGEKAYSIAIFALDYHWPEFEEEANEILDSVQIVP